MKKYCPIITKIFGANLSIMNKDFKTVDFQKFPRISFSRHVWTKSSLQIHRLAKSNIPTTLLNFICKGYKYGQNNMSSYSHSFPEVFKISKHT